LEKEDKKDNHWSTEALKLPFGFNSMSCTIFVFIKNRFCLLWICFPFGFHFRGYSKGNYLHRLVTFAHVSLNNH
jgi:hypothetical protein